ncbi:unnamed protein product [Cylicocyclus nassatus]|uniref:Uncharacterized protein n=1 Tax=Cylicocyclus nassatus TaxID=53992 RepID=A0AA36DIM6_CYLNA|nr:unnamed protein product [Cylicocyclus nassatus]
MFLFLLLPSFVLAQHKCWFEGFTWDHKAPSIPGVPGNILKKIKEDTGKEIDGTQQVLIIQMEVPENMKSFLLVAAKAKNEPRKYCFVGHAGHTVVFSFKIGKKCIRLLRKDCYNKGLSKEFMGRFIQWLRNRKI